MTTVQALALRRAGTAAAALAVTVGAHVQGDGARIGLTAPFVWAMIVAAAALIGPRAGHFRPRGPVRMLALLLVLQIAAHAAMAVAPWAFGLSAHHAGPLLTPGALLAHVVAALVLALLLARAERVVARLVSAVVALVRQALERPPAAPRSTVLLSPAHRAPVCARPHRAHLTRGPPLLVG